MKKTDNGKEEKSVKQPSFKIEEQTKKKLKKIKITAKEKNIETEKEKVLKRSKLPDAKCEDRLYTRKALAALPASRSP